MKRYFHLLIPLLVSFKPCLAQQSAGTPVEPPKRYNHSVALGVQVPWGSFSETHTGGVSADHSWSRHRFGSDAVTYKKIGFIVNSGIQYFLGNEINTAGHGFRYGNYLTLYSMPGVVYVPMKKISVCLLAGPEVNFYRSTANAALGVQFNTSYYLSKKIAIGPGVIYRKRMHTDALWTAAIRASYAL